LSTILPKFFQAEISLPASKHKGTKKMLGDFENCQKQILQFNQDAKNLLFS